MFWGWGRKEEPPVRPTGLPSTGLPSTGFAGRGRSGRLHSSEGFGSGGPLAGLGMRRFVLSLYWSCRKRAVAGTHDESGLLQMHAMCVAGSNSQTQHNHVCHAESRGQVLEAAVE